MITGVDNDGEYGAEFVIDLVVTACVGEAHMIKHDYFIRAGKDIRRLLGTEVWSGLPCSVLIPGFEYPGLPRVVGTK